MRAMTFRKTAIAVCLLLVAAGCVSPRMRGDASTLRPSIARIEARGVLLVGSTGDYRPLTWRDPETGRWEGFGIEVAERTSRRDAVPLEEAPPAAGRGGVLRDEHGMPSHGRLAAVVPW